MGQKIILTGKTFGKLLVVAETKDREKNGAVIWKCLCDCGNFTILPSGSLLKLNTRSCGKCSKNIFYEENCYVVGVTTNGEKFIIDKSQLKLVKEYSWFKANTGYICSRINGKIVLLHRFLINPLKEFEIDHINNIRSDNRTLNLRIVTRSQNSMNASKSSNTSSKYKGVSYSKHRNKWEAYITCNKKRYNLGKYVYEEDAAKAYNEKAKELFGEYAKLNLTEAI